MTAQLWAELLTPFLFLGGALLWRNRRSGRRRGAAAAVSRPLARRPAFAVALCFAAGFGASAITTWMFGPPIPQSHDEFCYLLQARTFAAGRLTNPTPPLAEHFESPHLLLQPTYTGKYHPAQALVLAAGLAATGSVVVGLWLQVGLFGAALMWMLLQWLPPRWAVGSALVATIWCGAASYWGYSFWGGCVPAAAGALVLGAVRRLAVKPSAPTGAVLGSGLALLALSRPFEGLLLSAVALVWLLVRVRRIRCPPVVLLKAGAAAAIVPGIAAVWLFTYDRAVTGDGWLLPYVLYETTYDATPLFVWQSPRAVPRSRFPELDRYWRLGFEQWQKQRSVGDWLRGAWANLRKLASFFLGAALWAPLLALRARPGPVRLAIAALLAVLGGVLTITFCVPHYLAPATSLVVVLVVIGLRRLRRWEWRGKPLGAQLAACALTASLGVLPLSTVALGEARREGWGREREDVAARLRALSGDDLVFVHFGGGMIDPGWIYNDPDLDRSPIVWARPIDAEQDCALVARLGGRRVWRLELRDVGGEPALMEAGPPGCATTRG